MQRDFERRVRPSMISGWAAVVVLCGIVSAARPALGGDVPAAAPSPADPTLAARVKHVLRGLQADEFSAREAASLEMETLPAEAVPLLEQAVATGRLIPEVSARIDARISLLRRKIKTSPLVKEQERVADFVRDGMLRDYEQGGHTGPKWDEATRKALLLSIYPFASKRWSSHDAARALEALRQAVAAGCDDPWVRFTEIQLLRELEQITLPDATDRLGPVVDAIVAGNSAEWRKAVALVYRARVRVEAAGWPIPANVNGKVDADIDAAMKRFSTGVRRSDIPPGLILTLAESFCDPGAMADGWRHGAMYPKLLAVLKDNRGHSADVFAAWYQLAQLPEARRSGKEAIERRLTAARQALAKAIETEPTDPAPPTMMLSVIEALRTRTPEMETWFARAVESNPGSLEAYRYKMFYLARFATPQEVLAFAREVRASDDWQNRLPFLLVDAHLRLGNYRPWERNNEYLASDPDAWREVADVYEQLLRRYPDAVSDRSFFANLAARSGHWDVAVGLLQALGDDAVVERFNGSADFAYLKRKGEAAVRVPPVDAAK